LESVTSHRDYAAEALLRAAESGKRSDVEEMGGCDAAGVVRRIRVGKRRPVWYIAISPVTGPGTGG